MIWRFRESTKVVDRIVSDANALIEHGDLNAARKLIESEIHQHPCSITLRRLRLKIAQEDKDSKALLDHSEALLKIAPDLIDVRIIRARRLPPDRLEDEVLHCVVVAEKKKYEANMNLKLMSLILQLESGYKRRHYLSRLVTVCRKRKATPSWLACLASLHLALEDYDSFNKVCEKLKGGFVNKSVAANSILKVHDKIMDKNFPNYSAEKVFCVGLSRTGTTSLNNALNLLGYASAHWLNPITGGLLMNDDYLLFDSFTDITVSANFEWLYMAFPNSKFIYTTRPIASWAESTRDHYHNNRNITHPGELLNTSKMMRQEWASSHVESSLYGHHDSWEAAYDYHDQRVRKFFADKDPNRFMEASIVTGDGWDKLAEFLGKPIPTVPFPSKNKRPLPFRNAS